MQLGKRKIELDIVISPPKLNTSEVDQICVEQDCVRWALVSVLLKIYLHTKRTDIVNCYNFIDVNFTSPLRVVKIDQKMGMGRDGCMQSRFSLFAYQH